jgi:hypothetical protein
MGKPEPERRSRSLDEGFPMISIKVASGSANTPPCDASILPVAGGTCSMLGSASHSPGVVNRCKGAGHPANVSLVADSFNDVEML